MLWDGHFPLTVNFLGTKNQHIIDIAAQPLSHKEYAVYVKTVPGKLARELDLKHMDWIEGQPFNVQVPCSGRRSEFGRELTYSQFQLLVLRIGYQDGKVEFIPIEIPDGRVNRKLTVTIPQ
jgi:hypothetical protein